jgi:hypothetical protein
MADRSGVGPLVAYASATSGEEELVRRSIEAAGWHLNVKPGVIQTEAELRSRLVAGEPGVLLILEPSALIQEAMVAGWIVLTSRRHRDASHGRELFWVAAQRAQVLISALLHVARMGPELAPIRRAARALGRSLTREEFLAHWAAPLVSVIMPLFNHEDEVLSAMRSVLAQTLADFELIVVDDGSTDASRARTFEIRDPRVVRVWQAGGGPSSARNAGLVRARAENYLAFLDSDDLWEPLFLERLVETLEMAPRGAGLAYCDYGFSLDGGDETVLRVEDASFPTLVLSDGLIPTGSFVFRRSILAEAGLLDEDLTRAEDYVWLLRLAAKFELVRVPEVLFHYRRSSRGQLLTSTLDLQRLEQPRMDALEAWARRVLPRARSRYS